MFCRDELEDVRNNGKCLKDVNIVITDLVKTIIDNRPAIQTPSVK